MKHSHTKLSMFIQWILTFVLCFIIALSLSSALSNLFKDICCVPSSANFISDKTLSSRMTIESVTGDIGFGMCIILHILLTKYLVVTVHKSKTKDVENRFVAIILVLCLLTSSIIIFRVLPDNWREMQQFANTISLILVISLVVIDLVYFRMRLKLSRIP